MTENVNQEMENLANNSPDVQSDVNNVESTVEQPNNASVPNAGPVKEDELNPDGMNVKSDDDGETAKATETSDDFKPSATDSPTSSPEDSGSIAQENDAGTMTVEPGQWSQLEKSTGEMVKQRSLNMLLDLELPISVELGRVKMLVKEILELGPGAVVELNKFSGEPVDLYVNDRKFAEGEVVVVDHNFGVRLTALVGPDERLQNLNQ